MDANEGEVDEYALSRTGSVAEGISHGAWRSEPRMAASSL
jgi:hypothetical protein